MCDASHRGEPFFLYVAYNAPHPAMHAPQADMDCFPGLTCPIVPCKKLSQGIVSKRGAQGQGNEDQGVCKDDGRDYSIVK